MNVQSNIFPEKKTAILNSTLKLVREYGFHGCPMSQIADDAGVAAGTIYHYFESKEHLIFELFNQVKEEVSKAVFDLDEDSLPFKQRFFGVWNRYFDFMIKNPDALFFMEQYICSPYSQKDPDKQSDKLKLRFAEFFSSGIQQGIIKELPSFFIGPVLWGSIISISKVHLSGKHHFDEKDLEKTAYIIWDGLKTNQA